MKADEHGHAVHIRDVPVYRGLPQGRARDGPAHPRRRDGVGGSVQVREGQPAGLVVNAPRLHLWQRAGRCRELRRDHANRGERQV